jgi:HAE1 family hydrophobic/amphiphilic exporter-1
MATAPAYAQIVRVEQQPVSAGQSTSAPAVEQSARVGVDQSRPLSLTLFDAVRMALEQNRELEIQRINVRQAEYDLFGAKGIRDIGLEGAAYYEHRTIPVGSLLGGGPNGSLTTEAMNFDFGARQLTATGASWSANLINSRVDTNNLFSALNPQYTSSLVLQFSQPLMRNLSIDEARRRIKVASRRLDLSDSQFRQKAIEIVARVERAYWDLSFALRDLQIRRDSITLARTQLEHNRRMVDQGTLAPIDLVSVEVELQKRREDELSALDTVTRAENALKQLILGTREAQVWNQPVLPTDQADVHAAGFTLEEAYRAAAANRPELKQNSIETEINNIDNSYFSNQTKPQVDLISSYTSTGLAGTPTNTNPFGATTQLLVDRVNQLSSLQGLPAVPTAPPAQLPGFLLGGQGTNLSNLFSNDFRTFRFGVSIQFPLRNRTAEADLGRSLAEGRKLDAQRKSIEQSIEVEVRNALQAVEIGRLRVETSRASREAAQKQSESEERRFQAGLSTTFLVLDRQNALSEAQGRELRALIDYSKAVSELQRVMGTTLVRANVELTTTANKR